MGWSNYIIINKLKLVIETNRHVNELLEYEKEALDYLIDERDIIDIGERKVTSLTLKDLAIMTTSYDNACSLNGLDSDKLLLYWLESKEISYEILSEHNVDIDNFYKEGYTVLRLYD